jgi:hypothetical protein
LDIKTHKTQINIYIEIYFPLGRTIIHGNKMKIFNTKNINKQEKNHYGKIIAIVLSIVSNLI